MSDVVKRIDEWLSVMRSHPDMENTYAALLRTARDELVMVRHRVNEITAIAATIRADVLDEVAADIEAEFDTEDWRHMVVHNIRALKERPHE